MEKAPATHETNFLATPLIGKKLKTPSPCLATPLLWRQRTVYFSLIAKKSVPLPIETKRKQKRDRFWGAIYCTE